MPVFGTISDNGEWGDFVSQRPIIAGLVNIAGRITLFLILLEPVYGTDSDI